MKCNCGKEAKYEFNQHWYYDEYDDYENSGYCCSFACFLKVPFEEHNSNRFCGVTIKNLATKKIYNDSYDGMHELYEVFFE